MRQCPLLIQSGNFIRIDGVELRPQTRTDPPPCPLYRKAYYSSPSVRTLTIRTQQEVTTMLRQQHRYFASAVTLSQNRECP